MSMPTTEIRGEVDTISPFVGPTAPVLFGIEHEYALSTDPDDDGCRCSDCYDPDYDDNVPPDARHSASNLLPGWSQHSEHCGWEIKTPPMDDIDLAVREFRRIERELGWGGHYNCGYHIHVNANPAKGPAVNVVKFAENWLAHQSTLWRHCPCDDGYLGFSSREYASDMEDSVEFWMQSRERYRELNWGSLEAHMTLEVRAATATSNMEHFELWLRYVLAIAERSLLSDDPVADYDGHVRHGVSWADYPYNAAGVHLAVMGIEVEALQVGEAVRY